MVVFPNAKINLGLNITDRRNDGYHNILSVFYPINICDGLEFVENSNSELDKMYISGLPVPGNKDKNLCFKALELMRAESPIPPLIIYLYKNIPMGAGLGGGSADGSFFLIALNSYYNIGLSMDTLKKMALKVGSDCPFFIENTPCAVSGRGEDMTDISPILKGKYIVIVFSDIHISTASAYREMNLKQPKISPSEVVLNLDLKEWKNVLHNDFELFAFSEFPQLQQTKESLYKAGADYASMTGSGSAIYGIFEERPIDLSRFARGTYWIGKL